MSAPLPFRVSRRLSRKLSSAVGRTAREMRSRASDVAHVAGARPGRLEELEPRRLFTTLVGGDSFEFLAPDPANPQNAITNRIVLTGNIVAELVGGTLDNTNNTVTISDVPGAFNQSAIRGLSGFTYNPTDGVLGGVGGGSGVRQVAANGGLSITDSFDNQGNVPYFTTPVAGIARFNFRALATDSTNTTYGFNVVRIGAASTAGERSIIQLVRIAADGTSATVVADVGSAFNGGLQNSNFQNSNGVTDVTAAAFDPVSGLLYFVVRGRSAGIPAGATNTTPLPTTQQLFTLKIGASAAATITSVKAISGSFLQNPGFTTVVTALAFDQTSATARDLYGFIVRPTTDTTLITVGSLFQVNLGNTDTLNNLRDVTAGNNVNINGVTGLAFVNPSATASETAVFAVESTTGNLGGTGTVRLANSTTGPQILTIPLTGNARATQLGRLQDPAATVQPIVGADLQDLTYNPAIRNPFTGQLGVLLSVDNTTDQLLYIDSRNRFPGVGAFELYIAQSDASATVTWAIVPNIVATDPGAERDMQPFSGSAGTLTVNNTKGQLVNVASPGNIGGVFLGSKTSGHTDTNAALENNIPIITSQLSSALGVAPGGIQKTGIVSSRSLLSALTNSISLADRLLGQNVTDIEGLVVTSAGTIYAVDSDFVGAGGGVSAYNDFVTIDRTTGKATASASILPSTGALLSSNRGATVTETDKILAIFLQQMSGDSGNTGGTLTGGITLPTDQSGISIAVSGDGAVGYLLAETSTAKYLYRFNKAVDGTITFTPLGQIVDADGNTIAQAQGLGLNSSGQLFTVGFDAGNPNPTQSTGQPVGTQQSVSGSTPKNITYASDGSIYLLSFGTGGVSVRLVPRDPLTGQLLSPTTAPTVITVNGGAVQNVNAISANSQNNGLYAIGSSQTSLSPTLPAGNLTDSTGQSNFIYRGLTKIGAKYYAITSDGTTLVLRGVTTTTTGSVVAGAFNVIGRTVSDGIHAPYTEATRTAGLAHADDIRYSSATGTTAVSTAVLDINALADSVGDFSNVYGVGFGADEFIPTAGATNPVVGQLDLEATRYTTLTTRGFSTVQRYTDANVLPTTQNAPGSPLVDSLITPTVIANAGVAGGLGGSTAVGVSYTLPYVLSRYNSAIRDTSTGGILSAFIESFGISVIGQNSGVNPKEDVAPLTSLQAADADLANRATLANAIVQNVSLGSAGANTLYTSGFNIDSPIPALPIAGTLGASFGSDSTSGQSNLRSIAFESYTPAETEAALNAGTAATLGDGYVLVANTPGFTNLYRLTRDPSTGGIAGFARVDTGANGLLDDVTGGPISFAYTLTADSTPGVSGQYYFIGSPSPGQSTADMFLYRLNVTFSGSAPTVSVHRVLDGGGTAIDLSTATATTGYGAASTGQIWKASAVDLQGNFLYLVLDGDANQVGIQFTQIANSELFRLSLAGPGAGTLEYLGAMGDIGFGGGLDATGPTFTQNIRNANIRAMQFKVQADGREVLLALDAANNVIGQYDLNGNGFKAAPLAGTIDGGSANISGVPNGPFTAVIGIETTQPGQLRAGLNTFAIDQYGRSFAAVSNGNQPAYLITSPNELFEVEDDTLTDQDGDGFIGETTRVGYLSNPDGTAFTDTLTNIVEDLRPDVSLSGAQGGLIVTYRNIYAAGEHPWAYRTTGSGKVSMANVERMAVIKFSAGTGNVDAPGLNRGVGTSYVIQPIGTTQELTSDAGRSSGRISINGVSSSQSTAEQVNTTPGTFQGYSNIRGLAWAPASNGNAGDVEELLGLNVGQGDPNNYLAGGGPELVAFNLHTDSQDTTPLDDPTYETRTITDNTLDYTPAVTGSVADAAWTTANPAGFAIDTLGRYYTIDNAYADPAFGTVVALEGSRNQPSLFTVSTAGGTNVSATERVKLSEQLDPTNQQTPNPFTPTPFNAIAIYDANGDGIGDTVYLVQRDVRVGTGIDRLVTFTLPAGSGTTSASFRQYNQSAFAGQIQIGNNVAPGNGATPNGTPTNIVAMDFTSSGLLIGLNSAGGLATFGNQIIQILDAASATTDPQSPTDAVLISGSAALSGLTIQGTSVSAIDIASNPDRIVVSQNTLELYSVTPGGVSTDQGPIIDGSGNGLADTYAVTAMATQPGTGLLYFIIRSIDAAAAPADFLYMLDPTVGQATALGQILIGSNNSAITSLSFAAPAADGSSVLIGLNDPTSAGGDRQLVRVNITTPGSSTFVPGSAAGSISDSLVGIASDVNDNRANAIPVLNRGRFYSVDISDPTAIVLRVTPQNEFRLVDGNDSDGLAHFANQGAVGAPAGLALFDTIRSLDFTPAGAPGGANQLFGIRNPLATSAQITPQISRLVSFPATTTSIAGLPEYVLGGNQQILVTSASAFPGATITPITSAQPEVVKGFAFLGDGSIRALDAADRLVDFTVNTPGAAVARTEAGAIDDTIVGFANDDSGTFYGLQTATNPATIVVSTGTGVFPSSTSNGGGVITGALGSPVLGVIDPLTHIFTPVAGTVAGFPGRLPTSITDVKAIAYDRYKTKKLYVVDQNSTLIEISPLDGSIIRTAGQIHDAITGQTLDIGSMTFDGTGRLLAQDLSNSRIVDVSTDTAAAGLGAATPVGSLPNTVGAIAYDPIGNRLLIGDNATGINTTAGTSGTSSQLLQANINLTSTGQDIGKVFIGGTVTGGLDFGGSVGTFYSGWIVTGTIGGLTLQQANPTPQNFRVGGNLGTLVTTAPFGGTAVSGAGTTYVTDTDLFVNGRIGLVRALSDIEGTIRAAGSNVANGTAGLGADELEFRDTPTAPQTDAQLAGVDFQAGTLHIAALNNDSAATSDRLFPQVNADGTTSGVAIVNGDLQSTEAANDVLDFYSAPLLGGQTITVQLAGAAAGLYFAIEDVDGRILASSHSQRTVVTSATSLGSVDNAGAFRFTAGTPGEYRIVIAQEGDTNFNGVFGDAFESVARSNAEFPYILTVSGLGSDTIGAVVASGTILDHGADALSANAFDFSTIYAATGDIGSVFANTAIAAAETVTSNTIRAQTGSIRSVIAGSIGLFNVTTRTYSASPSLSAGGDVGLVFATSGTGALFLNESLTPPPLTTNVGVVANYDPAYARVGGNFQELRAANTFLSNIFADKGIGNILAGDMASLTPSLIIANADNMGADGTIDMIDVTGDLGTLGAGGPVIYTNSGGNVRYIRAGGNLFRDAAFGGGAANDIFLAPGQNFHFTDDSGAILDVSFDTRTFTPGVTDTTTGALLAPQIAYRAYPVRSGGSVLVLLQVSGLGNTNTLTPGAPMVTFHTSGTGGSVDIGSINLISTNANPITITPGTSSASGTTAATFTQAATNSYYISIGGSAKLNASLVQITTPAGAAGDASGFTDTTGGEILDFRANDVGTFYTSGSLGIAARSVTGTTLTTTTGTSIAGYPFDGIPFAASFNNVNTVTASGAIGALLVANANMITAGVGGIQGPILAQGVGGVAGLINTVNIGDGLGFAGSGLVSTGGIYSTGTIGTVQGSGDVRGIIAARQQIGGVNIGGNGSLIGAFIVVTSNDFQSLAPINEDFGIGLVLNDFENTNGGTRFTKTYEIGSIRAAGGIIGSQIAAADINTISAGGFGIFTTTISSGGNGTLSSISAAGYGIRNVIITNFSFVGSINATGKGTQLPITSVSPSVRGSEFQTIDPVTGYPIGRAYDVSAFLSVNGATPVIEGITNTGIIEDLVANGNDALSSISAYQIRGSSPGVTNTQLNFSGTIGTIKTTSLIDGLTVKAGRINTFSPGSDVLALDLTVSGAFNAFKINGNLGSNSTVNIAGPNASLKSFTVKGNFDGSLNVSGKVGTITIGGNLTTGTIHIAPVAGPASQIALGTLKLGGSVSGASLNVQGNVGTINVAGTLGTAGDNLVVGGNISSLMVGTNKKIGPGKVLALNVNATGSIKVVSVSGRISGALTAGGSIGSIKVASDGDANRISIGGPVAAGVTIGTVSVTKGDIAGNISAFSNIKSVSIVGGSYNAGATLSSVAGSIGTVSVKAGNLLASVIAGSSDTTGLRPITSITVDGHVGDGINPLSIKASSLKSFKSGELFSGTTITVPGTISSLTINGDIQPGATVNAGAILKRKITGTVAGQINITG